MTGVAKLKDDPDYDLFRQGRPVQRTRAWELHRQAGVPIRAYGVEEIEKFQAVLMPDIKIVVVSAEYFDGIVYKGPTCPETVYLYNRDPHFELITSMPAFCGSVYCCLKCERGYNTEDYYHHKCDFKCLACHETGCEDMQETNQRITCGTCNRAVKGQHCMRNHRTRGAGGGMSVCQMYRKSKTCMKTGVRMQELTSAERCDAELVNATNQKTTLLHDETEKSKKRKRDEEEEEEEQKDEEKDEEKASFLFFDFECIQESGEHIPSLVVAQNDAGQGWVFSGSFVCGVLRLVV